jgi:hypothetical protein
MVMKGQLLRELLINSYYYKWRITGRMLKRYFHLVMVEIVPSPNLSEKGFSLDQWAYSSHQFHLFFSSISLVISI